MAAAILGVKSDKLRRWLREGKFDFSDHNPPIPHPMDDPESPFMKRRLFTKEWLVAAATQLGRKPNFDVVNKDASNG